MSNSETKQFFFLSTGLAINMFHFNVFGYTLTVQ